MAWIQIKTKKPDVSEELLTLGVTPKEEDFRWVDAYIRSEDISEFYAISAAKIVICFYDERAKLVVRDNIEEFRKRVQLLDYDVSLINIDIEEES